MSIGISKAGDGRIIEGDLLSVHYYSVKYTVNTVLWQEGIVRTKDVFLPACSCILGSGC